MFEHVEMHGNVAAPGVLAEDGGTEIPARVADARQLFAGVARLERRGGQHGPIVERGCAGLVGRAHARASGGGEGRPPPICWRAPALTPSESGGRTWAVRGAGASPA